MESAIMPSAYSVAGRILATAEKTLHFCMKRITELMTLFSQMHDKTSSYRAESMELSLNEILELENRIQQGKVRISSSDMRAISQLKSMILFFHEVFPDSDPYGMQKYSLRL